MARQSQMAAIDQFVQAGKAPAKASPAPAAAPHAAPGVNAPTPITGGGNSGNSAPTFSGQNTDSLNELTEGDITEHVEEGSIFDKSGNQTAGVIDRLLRGTSVKLSNLPDPGGITLPLIVLFVFFIFLIPVNGHTRLTWLWLTLTGNASIGQSSNTPASQAGPTAPIANAPATGGSGQPGNPLIPTQTSSPVFTPGGNGLGPLGLSQLPTLATYAEGS